MVRLRALSDESGNNYLKEWGVFTVKGRGRMQRMAIIALDGLEPSLITDKTPNLLQDAHGTVDVDVSPLQTPVIWAAFLTGQKDNGVEMIKFPYDVDEKISRVLDPKRVAAINRFSSNLPISTVSYTKHDLMHPTIFDLVEKHVALDIPSYNEDPVYLEIRRKIAFAIGGQYPEDDLVREVWDRFHEEYETCMKMLDEDWDLFMVHFFVTDVIGHLSLDNVDKLTKCYQTMDHKIGTMTRRIKDSVILIVSDHGMQNGLHTRKGFYSINKPLYLHSPKITDFYEIIRQILFHKGAFSESGEADRRLKVLQHLKELGYF